MKTLEICAIEISWITLRFIFIIIIIIITIIIITTIIMFILLIHEIHHLLSTKTTKQSVFWLNFSTPPRHSAKPRRWASMPRWCNHHCLLNRHDHPTSSDSSLKLHLGVVERVEVVTGELWKQESMLMLLEFHTSSTWHHITISEYKWIKMDLSRELSCTCPT